MLSVAPEAAGLRSVSSSRWMVFASIPVCSVMRLAARPVGAASKSSYPLGGENTQDGVEQRRLANAGTASDDGDLRAQHNLDRGALRCGQCLPVFFSTQGTALSTSISAMAATLGQGLKALGDAALGEIEPRRNTQGRSSIVSATTSPSASSWSTPSERCSRRLRVMSSPASPGPRSAGRSGPRRWPLAGRRKSRRAPAVALPVSYRASWRWRRRCEPNAANVAGQPIWVLGHDLDGVMAIGLEDVDGPRRADAVEWKKTMMSRTAFCSAQPAAIFRPGTRRCPAPPAASPEPPQ